MKPVGGIIKVMGLQGRILERFWLTEGIDRGDEWPEQKWDFRATDEHGREVAIQIGLIFLGGDGDDARPLMGKEE